MNNFNKIHGKVLFLGDSITDGGQYVSFFNTFLEAFCPEADISVFNLGVSSETLSGLSEEEHPFPRPCLFGRLERALETVKPDFVFSLYGVNDGIYHPFSEERFDAFKNGCLKLAETIEKIGAPLIVLTPVPFDVISYNSPLADDGFDNYGFMATYKNYNDVMKTYSDWIINEMPKHCSGVIDIFGAMTKDRAEMRLKNPTIKVGDGIHPDMHGNLIMAKTIIENIFDVNGENFINAMTKDKYRLFKKIYNRDMLSHRYYKETVGHDNEYKDKFLPLDKVISATDKENKKIKKYIKRHKLFAPKNSRWNGFKKSTFYFEGTQATIVFPRESTENGEWVWRTEFFGAFPIADIEMVKKGFHLVHLSIPDQFGSPKSVDKMKRFNDFIIKKYNLSKRSILFGFSRGGLYALHYAAKFPQNVSALYLDAPVVDIKSWPFGEGTGKGSECDKEICLKAFEIKGTDEYENIMISAIDSVSKAKIPLIIVAGDSDDVVPYNENGLLLEKIWKENNLKFSIILKKGIGHHPHSLENPAEIVDFLIKNKI